MLSAHVQSGKRSPAPSHEETARELFDLLLHAIDRHEIDNARAMIHRIRVHGYLVQSFGPGLRLVSVA